ncbi:MAG: nucleoside monophosphate kinase [Puniceicoccaceae bacterium]
MESPTTPKVQDLEVKDPVLIFNRIWDQLEAEHGRENLCFPGEIFWLNGAPGSGKGTNTRFISKLRDLTSPPVIVSELLQSPEAQKRIDAGLLVGDKEVTELVLSRLLSPEYRLGAIVDGYPRTRVQVECLKLLYARMNELFFEALEKSNGGYNKPKFHIIVLFIDERESVRRQILRGQQMLAHNAKVEASGVGTIQEIRQTDLSEEKATGRYRTFKEITYDALKSLREVFHYHFIDAQGEIPEVQKRIVDELRYQSSLELNEATQRRLANIPVANELAVHARQQLIQRLQTYEAEHSDLFAKVIEEIESYFLPIVQRHTISGMALINSENPLFDNPRAVGMLIDVFSERGFHAVVDVNKVEVPYRVDLHSGEIMSRIKRIYRVRISFGGLEIRRTR